MQYTEIVIALKIEEKIYLIVYTLEPPGVKIKKQKHCIPHFTCIPHYIKVGYNGINVQLSCKLT